MAVMRIGETGALIENAPGAVGSEVVAVDDVLPLWQVVEDDQDDEPAPDGRGAVAQPASTTSETSVTRVAPIFFRFRIRERNVMSIILSLAAILAVKSRPCPTSN